MRNRSRRTGGSSAAFTLVEVLVALAVLAIGLTALVRLQVISITMTDRAERLSRAVLVGADRLAEASAGELTETGTSSGSVEDPDVETVYRWRVRTSRAGGRQLEDANATGLRQVDVLVSWVEGRGRREVRLTTLVPGTEVTR